MGKIDGKVVKGKKQMFIENNQIDVAVRYV